MFQRASFLDFNEMRAGAKRFLPRALFDYIDRGTEGEHAILRLRHEFDARVFVPKSIRRVESPSLQSRYLGQPRALPWVIAPTALAGLVRYQGEGEMAKAAARAGVPFCVATQSSSSIEDIRSASPEAELWFQLYPWQDDMATMALVARAKACGVTTLMVTLDTPGSPKKVHNQRNGFGVPLKPSVRMAVDCALHPCWSLGVIGRYLMAGGVPSYAHYPLEAGGSVTRAISDPRFSLKKVIDLEWLSRLRAQWQGPLIAKGILSAKEAAALQAIGFDGIVVSSHGGRNLDSAVTPLSVLPQIRAAVGKGMTVFADSGLRRGSDAAKLLAAGADGVLTGRLPLYALACGGADGVVDGLAILSQELSSTMEFLGVADLAELRA